MTTNPDTTATTQPALPSLELPDYHGRKPIGMRTTLNGAGTRISRAHGIDERVVLVIEGVVKHAGHDSTDDGLVYVEKVKVVDLYELDRDPGSRLLSALRSAHRTAEDDRSGRQPVPGLGEVGYTDASGVVLTPAEVAALRGDPIRVLVTDELTPAVIVFDDGTRLLWPDEFEPNAPRPFVGEEAAGVVVLEVLHTVTGEPLGAAAVAMPVPLPAEAVADQLEHDDVAELLRSAETANEEALAGTWEAGPASEQRAAERWGTDTMPDPDEPPAPAEPIPAEHRPTEQDFVTVEVSLNKLAERLPQITDEDQLVRLLNAERGRRGDRKPRKGAVDAIENRIAALQSAAAAAAATVDRIEEW